MPLSFRDSKHPALPATLDKELMSSSTYMAYGSATLHARVTWERSVVLALAGRIEPDLDKLMGWFVGEGIEEFAGKTAQQMIEEGATAKLLNMLTTIQSGLRDA